MRAPAGPRVHARGAGRAEGVTRGFQQARPREERASRGSPCSRVPTASTRSHVRGVVGRGLVVDDAPRFSGVPRHGAPCPPSSSAKGTPWAPREGELPGLAYRTPPPTITSGRAARHAGSSDGDRAAGVGRRAPDAQHLAAPRKSPVSASACTSAARGTRGRTSPGLMEVDRVRQRAQDLLAARCDQPAHDGPACRWRSSRR